MAPITRAPMHFRTSFEPEVLVKKKMQILGEKLFGALAHLGLKKKDEESAPARVQSKLFESEESTNDVDSSYVDLNELTESRHFTSENSLSSSFSSEKLDVGHSVSLLNTQKSEKISPDIICRNDERGVETILQPNKSFGSTSDVGNDISLNSKEGCGVPRVQSPLIDYSNFKIDFSTSKRQKDRHVKLMINRSYFALPSVTSKIIDERNRALFERLTPIFNNSIIDQIFDGKELLNSPTESKKNNSIENLNVDDESRICRGDSVKSERNTERVENIPEDRVETCIDPLTSKLYQVDYGKNTIKRINYEDIEFIDSNTQETLNIKAMQPLDKTSCNQEKTITDSKAGLRRSLSANNITSSETLKSKKLLHSIKSPISRHRIFVRKKSVRGNLQCNMSMFQSYLGKHVGTQNTHPEPFSSAKDIQQNQVVSPIVGEESDEIHSVSSIKSMDILNSQILLTDVEQNKIPCPTPVSVTKENARNKKPKKTNSVVRLHKVSNSDVTHGNNKPEKRRYLKRRKESRIQNLRSKKTSHMSPNKDVSSDLNNSKKTSTKKKTHRNIEIRIRQTSRSITRKSARKSSKTNTRGHKQVYNENINTHVTGNTLPNRLSQHRLTPTSVAITGVDRTFPHKAIGRFRNANIRPKSHNGKIRASSLIKTYQQREFFREVSKSRDRGSRTLLPIQKRTIQKSVSQHTKSQLQKLPVEDHSYSRRRPATATTKKSSFKKRSSSTNVKYTEKQSDSTTARMCVTPNPNPRVPNNTDMESQIRAYSCLSKKNKFKSRTRSFVSLHRSPPLNRTVGKCCTKRKSRRSTFLESRLDNRPSNDEVAKATLRSTTSFNNVSLLRNENPTQNSMSPLFNTQQNVVLDDSIFFTYHEPIIKSNKNKERKIKSASRSSSPRTINSLYFSIDCQKGMNYISDICIANLLSPSKSVIIKEINDSKDEDLHLPQQDDISVTKLKASNPECMIPTFRKEDKLKKYDKAKEFRECTKIITLNEEMDINGTTSSRFIKQNSECNTSKNLTREEENTTQRIIYDNNNEIKFQSFEEKKEKSFPLESNKSCENEPNNLFKNMEKNGFQYVLKEVTEDNDDRKRFLSTSEERNMEHKRSNETSLLAMNECSKNNVAKEGNHETSSTFRSILKKGTNDWTNITSFPEKDSPPQEYHTKHEEKTLNIGLNFQKNSSTAQSSENLKSSIHKQDKNWPKPFIKSHRHPSIITDYSFLQEFTKDDTMTTGKPYNFFIHSSPVTVLSDSNISTSSDRKSPLIQEIINTTESVRRYLLSQSSHLHKAHFETDEEKIMSSKTTIGNSDGNDISSKRVSGNTLVSTTTALGIEKLKPVTSRKTVTFKIPMQENARVKDTPSIHFPQQQEDLPDSLQNNDVNHYLQLKELKKYTSRECQETKMAHSPALTPQMFSSLSKCPTNNLREPNELTTFKQSTIKNVLKKNQYSPYIRQIKKRKTKIIHKHGRSFSSKPPVWVTSQPACSTSWIDIRVETPPSKGEHSTETLKDKHYSPHRDSSYDISNSSSSQPSKRTSSGKRNVSPVLGFSLKRPLSRAVRSSTTRKRTNTPDPQSVAKSPTRISNTVNYSQDASGRTGNHHSLGNNRSTNLSESVGEFRQNKRHASIFRKDLCLKTSSKTCSGTHYFGPLRNNDGSISDAIWDEYKKLGSTISKPLRDAIFKKCGLKHSFSDSTQENNIGDNGFREEKHYSISSPRMSPQNLRSIGYENAIARRCVSSAGKRRAIVFSGRPVSKTCHQPFLTKGTLQKFSKYSQEDSQRNKKSRFIDGSQYMLSKEFQSVARDAKKRASHHYDRFEFPVLGQSMSR